MIASLRTPLLFILVAFLFIGTGMFQSWDYSLRILNYALISAIMALGVNLQWGYAGLFNIGIMGFVALGGLAAVLVSMPVTEGAWSPGGGLRILLGLVMGAATIVGAVLVYVRMKAGWFRTLVLMVIIIGGFFLFRAVFDGGVEVVEAIDPAGTGYLGGLSLPVLLSWPVGGVMAAGAAWIIGKIALGLRSDYLAIATLGIAEILLAIVKNEEWLSRGVKNVNAIPSPVWRPIDLQGYDWFIGWADALGMSVVSASTLFQKILLSLLFAVVLLGLLWLAQRALKSPWGRMMRAIRDNETAAEAMGKDVTGRHLQVFILGSAICGLAGAMIVTVDGLLSPTSYQPLRFTFLIWVMVIVGGSGNNFGAVLGGFLIWWFWNVAEDYGPAAMEFATSFLNDGYWLKDHLIEGAPHMRLIVMGLILLLVLRFAPRGLLPER